MGKVWTLRFATLAAFVLAWELLARSIHSILLPPFTQTLAALALLLTTGDLWQALWVSNHAMLLGFFAAAGIGIPTGLLMSRFHAFEQWMNPYMSILMVMPVSAVIPIVIMATGVGLVSRVLIVFSFAVVSIVVNTRAGVLMADRQWIEMTRSFGATEAQLWFKVVLRGALPGILTGLRLGLIRAIAGMITVELLLIAVGTGRLILQFQERFEAANLYAIIAIVLAEAIILAQACQWIERRASHWLDAEVTE